MDVKLFEKFQNRLQFIVFNITYKYGLMQILFYLYEYDFLTMEYHSAIFIFFTQIYMIWWFFFILNVGMNNRSKAWKGLSVERENWLYSLLGNTEILSYHWIPVSPWLLESMVILFIGTSKM